MDKTAGLNPCDFLNFWPKMDKIVGLTPCDFFNFWPSMDKTATPSDFQFISSLSIAKCYKKCSRLLLKNQHFANLVSHQYTLTFSVHNTCSVFGLQ